MIANWAIYAALNSARGQTIISFHHVHYRDADWIAAGDGTLMHTKADLPLRLHRVYRVNVFTWDVSQAVHNMPSIVPARLCHLDASPSSAHP